MWDKHFYNPPDKSKQHALKVAITWHWKSGFSLAAAEHQEYTQAGLKESIFIVKEFVKPQRETNFIWSLILHEY